MGIFNRNGLPWAMNNQQCELAFTMGYEVDQSSVVEVKQFAVQRGNKMDLDQVPFL